MRRIGGVLLFFLFVTQGFTQNRIAVDSLKTHIEHSKDSIEKADLLLQLALLFNDNMIDSTIWYSQKALNLSLDLNYDEGIAKSYNFLARVSIEKNKFTEAIDYLKKALVLFKTQQDSSMMLDCYRGLSYAYSFGSNQLTSVEFNLKALELAIPLKDTTSLSVIYNNIAVTYLKMKEYETSKLYFNRALKLDLYLNIPHDLGISYSNLGILNIRNNNIEEAVKNYNEVIRLIPLIDNLYVKSYLYISLIKFYTELEEFNTAQKYADSVSVICKNNEYFHIEARLYRRLGELMLKQNKYQESINCFDKGLKISSDIGIYEGLPDVYLLKADAYAQLHLYKKAYEAMNMSKIMQDSLKNSELGLLIGEYEEEQRSKNEIHRQQLEQDLKNQKIENNRIKMSLRFRYAIMIIVLLIVLVVLSTYLFRKAKKKNVLLNDQHLLIEKQKLQLEEKIAELKLSEENLQLLNATKDRFFSIIAHDLKSPFTAIIGYSEELTNSYEDYNDIEKKQMIDMIRKSSLSTFTLLENLLNWSQSQSGFIELNFQSLDLKKLTEESITAYLSAANFKNIQIVNNVEEGGKIWGDQETLKIVISNLFNNAIKFSEQDSKIVMSSSKRENQLLFCITDFGIGMNKQIKQDLFKVEKNTQRNGTMNEKGTGLGLILCQEFIEKNNGKIWVESQEGRGSMFCFSLPIK